MKILIPTAKEMNMKLDCETIQPLSQISRSIVDTLAGYDLASLAKHYKLKPEVAQKEADRWADLKAQTANHYPAWRLFDGLMYRQMAREQLAPEELIYLENHAFITSALYGIINVFEPIAPHRLDFLMGFQVNGQSLKALWREAFDLAVAQDDLLISLLSNEFETVFSKSVQDRMIKLQFMEEKEGKLKTHSTISKKARGKCLRAMVEQQVTRLEGIRALDFDGFTYRSDLSKDKLLTFVKSI